jgi:hypothetical protein
VPRSRRCPIPLRFDPCRLLIRKPFDAAIGEVGCRALGGGDAALWERRLGLRANLAMAVLSALAYWALVSRAVEIAPLVLSAFGGVGLLFVGVLVFSFMTTPATLALETHMEQEGSGEPWWSVTVSPVRGGPLRLQFVTRNLPEPLLADRDKDPTGGSSVYESGRTHHTRDRSSC